jgi:hypothetical protein
MNATARVVDDMPAEYDLDHSRARPNRFALRLPKGHVVGIVLVPGLAEVFESSEEVNRVLRSAIEAMPARSRDRERSAVKRSR